MKRAKWTLLDQFERDGKRYLIAVREEPASDGLALLSSRERQVVTYAARGMPNKVVGSELGIATSTVGVLLSRARAKLGARSRRELLGKLQGTLPTP
jgi:DNA-binding NarL/FixJ family response regulator